jgi:hypothetical protein
LARALLANGTSLRIGDSGMFAPRSDGLGMIGQSDVFFIKIKQRYKQSAVYPKNNLYICVDTE